MLGLTWPAAISLQPTNKILIILISKCRVTNTPDTSQSKQQAGIAVMLLHRSAETVQSDRQISCIIGISISKKVI